MNPKFANLKTLMAVLVVLGLAVVGTYAVRSALHGQSAGTVALAATSAQEPSKSAITATPPPVVGGGQFSPNVGQTYPDRVFWGVAHIHTGYSFDAGMFGITLRPSGIRRRSDG
jgi:Protein of unknown function (DUF3604)